MKSFMFILCMAAAATVARGQFPINFYYEGATGPVESKFETCEPFFDQSRHPLQYIMSPYDTICIYYQDKQCRTYIKQLKTRLYSGERTVIQTPQPSPEGIKCYARRF